MADCARPREPIKNMRHLILRNKSIPIPRTTCPRRNRIPMGTSPRMPQKSANLLLQLRANNMLKLTSMRISLRSNNSKRIGKQPFSQPVPPNHIARPIFSLRGQSDDTLSHFHQSTIAQAPHHAHRIHHTARAHALELRRHALFAANPNLLEQMIESFLILSRKSTHLHQTPMRQLNTPVRQLRNRSIMCHHQDRMPGSMQSRGSNRSPAVHSPRPNSPSARPPKLSSDD